MVWDVFPIKADILEKLAWNDRDTGDTRFVTVREVEVFRFHRFVTFLFVDPILVPPGRLNLWS